MGTRHELASEMIHNISAGATLVCIESYEWQRVEAVVVQVSNQLERRCLKWTGERDLRVFDGKRFTDEDPLVSSRSTWELPRIIRWFRDELDEPAVLHIEDYHSHFSQEQANGPDSPHPTFMEGHSMWMWRECARIPTSHEKTIIISGTQMEPFRDLAKEVFHCRLKLPDIDDLTTVHNEVRKSMKADEESMPKEIKVIEAARGMTVMEARHAYATAFIEHDRNLTEEAIPSIIRHKRSILRASGGMLDYLEPDKKKEDIGGLDNLIDWLELRASALTPEAREYGLEAPKGVLLLGVPGCGKSLTAQVIASMWRYPLVRFDLSRVFGSLVGESESKMQAALDLSEAVAPCILWIDEIEKGMAGAGSSGNLDSGVTARVFGKFLTWMQEKTAPVFVVATSNRVQNLPAEALRKGRFDEIFFVDLPDTEIRCKVLEIHLRRLASDHHVKDVPRLADMAQLFSGAELEQAVKDAKFRAFEDGARPIRDSDLIEVIGSTYPLAITMREDIGKLRAFAADRAQPADGISVKRNTEDIPKREDEENPYME